ncbi:MAG: putative quinol monooxygenase [Cucumibacter sp.]
MKFIIGWVTIKPAKRDAFFAAVRVHTAATRQEEGCVFFEINPGMERPNVAVVAECFKSEEVHQRHLTTPHMAAMRKAMNETLIDGKFQYIYSDNVVAEDVTFG